MDSNRHKRRLAKTSSDKDLLDLRKQIILRREKESNSTAVSLHEKQNSTYIVDVSNNLNEEQIIVDSNFEENASSIDCETATHDNNEILLNYNENEILSFCEERDVLEDEYTYRYSDSEESSDDDNINTSSTSLYEDKDYFKESIRSWALSFKLYQNAVKALLRILNENTNVNFPNDPRTFLNTPRSVQITKIKNGEYYHAGLKQAVKNIINKLVEKKILKGNNNEVSLLISTDGAPLGKSSSLSMWPILCSASIYSFVQVIGIYVGESKPEDSNEFFKFFTDEIKDLICNGIVVDEKKYKISVEGIICDTPAKSFVLKTKYFSGYNSCTKCQIYGTNVDNIVCFPNEDPIPLLRTDEKFFNFEYSEEFNDDYQKEESILKNIKNFGLVSSVPLDYMHLVCLGVMRKLLLLWLKGPLKCRLSSREVNKISEDLLELRKSVPSDFARKPRSLKYIKLWKATEFRCFLLYIGPVVLKSILSSDAYIHFLMLHIAIRILADKESVKNPVNINCARDLLKKFVQTFETIYGARYVSYNVHNLNHLTEDVIKFGPLDKFSAFQFESHICALKRLIRKGEKPLQQLAFRLSELDNHITHTSYTYSDNLSFSKKHHNGPLTNDQEYIYQYKIMRKKYLYLNCEDNKNDCIILNSSEIVRVFNFAKAENNNFYVIGELLIPEQNFYEVPYPSKLLNISIVKRSKRLKAWPCDEIYAKMCQLVWNNKLIVFPILHTSNQ